MCHMEGIRKITIVIALFVTGVCGQNTSTSAPQSASCELDSCGANQYCVSNGGSPVCFDCFGGCIRCNGPLNTNCKACQPGYLNVSNSCQVCPNNTYGVNCTGQCHCLYGDTDCDKVTGYCKSLKCALGWQNPPQCQTPCSNLTFGENCESLCHCPPDDQCSPTNGLCSGGSCANGWSGAGCQNELPQLSDPPGAWNVTCDNVTLTWLGWRRGEDRGNVKSVIRRYDLYTQYKLQTGEYSQWEKIHSAPQVQNQEEYSFLYENPKNDTYHQFRVNVLQADGDKTKEMNGKTSEPVFIPCIEVEPTTTPAPPGTTNRPPGPHILDENKFHIENFEAPTVVQVTWGVLDEMVNFTLDLELEYYEVKVIAADCPPKAKVVTTIGSLENSGSHNITVLLPWRQYMVGVTAVSSEYNLTDFITKDIYTPEDVPTGSVTNVHMQSVTKYGGLVTWNTPPCNLRNGELLFYTVIVKTSPGGAEVLDEIANVTMYEIDSLTPFTNYSVVVLYENSRGAGPEMTVPVSFKTAEDVPGAPTILNISAGLNKLTVTLVAPQITNGVLQEYKVIYDTDANFTSPRHIGQPVSVGAVLEVIGLEPNTKYYVKASARTSAGEGNASDTRTATTLQSLPDAPVDVTEDTSQRNESCVMVSWKKDSSVLGYNVTYRRAGAPSSESKTLVTSDTSVHLCDLESGAYYDFTIVPRSAAGYGTPAIITVSTEQPNPPIPRAPEVVNTTNSTIHVELLPVVSTTSSIKYVYLLSIDDITVNSQGRRKRATSRSNTTCPGDDEVPGNIVKNFTTSELLTKTEFLIGDGTINGIYQNDPLTTNNTYDIYFVIASYFENVCKYNHAKSTARAVDILPSTTQAPPTTIRMEPVEPDSSSNLGLIIALIVIILIVVIIIILIILYCLWKRRQSGQKYEPHINENEDFGLKVYRIDDYNAQKYWNTVYSLRESRYIIAGREHLLPDNKHAANGGQVGMMNGGPPVSFHAEFAALPHGPQSTNDIAKRRENATKNRFSHLLPYDSSRVILDPDIHSDSDYINASFMKGYKHQHEYIAAQSPYDPETVLDFWRMIDQYEVKVIVMMAKIVEDNIVKCTQFWPDNGRAKYGNFILDLVDTQEFASYTIRTLRYKTTEDRNWRMLYVFDLTYWPEHGVPDDPIPLLEMRRKVNLYQNNQTFPKIVHCGTGVSRTGVYIAVDSLLEQYEQEGRISVYSFVKKMRKDRIAMVRTVKQYIFIYEAIFEAMQAGNTLCGPEDMRTIYHELTKRNPQTKHSYLYGQFHNFLDFTRQLFPSTCSDGLLPINVNKNRFVEIVPPDAYRPVLVTPGGMGRTDYINAVFLDSHRLENHFLITQTPLHTTVIDFWKLIYDHDVYTIVMMEPMKYEDDTCAEYWPEDNMKQYEPFFVETVDVYQQENITIRNLKLTPMTNTNDVRNIRQFQFNAWSDSEFVPKSKSMLLDVIDLVNDWQRMSNNDAAPILVHCKDGATHSGLFIAVSVLTETIQDDSEVDVYHTIKHMKRRRTQIVDMLDQYRFCYKALWDFINMRMPGGTLTEQMSKTRSDRPYNSLSLASYTSVQEHMPY